MSTKNIAVFGLGSMGFGIALSILRAGHTTYGFDVASDPVARFVSEGGKTGDITEIISKGKR